MNHFSMILNSFSEYIYIFWKRIENHWEMIHFTLIFLSFQNTEAVYSWPIKASHELTMQGSTELFLEIPIKPNEYVKMKRSLGPQPELSPRLPLCASWTEVFELLIQQPSRHLLHVWGPKNMGVWCVTKTENRSFPPPEAVAQEEIRGKNLRPGSPHV